MRRPLTPQEAGLILGVALLMMCGCLGCVAASLVPPAYPPVGPVPTTTFSTSGDFFGGSPAIGNDSVVDPTGKVKSR